MPVPLLATIIAKVMMLVEGMLDTFVTLSIGTSIDNCLAAPQINAQLTNCGIDFVGYVSDMVVGLTHLGVNLLSGIGAAEVWPVG